jgi:hypothetical protein
MTKRTRGRCVRCGAALAPGSRRSCAYHLALALRHFRDRMQRQRAKGCCIWCEHPICKGSTVHCQKHHDLNRARAAARRARARRQHERP